MEWKGSLWIYLPSGIVTLATMLNKSRIVLRNLNGVSGSVRLVHVEAKLESMGLKMPTAAVPKGNFVNFVRIGNMVYLSGHLPQPAEGSLVVGKVGKELTVEDGSKLGLYICCTRFICDFCRI